MQKIAGVKSFAREVCGFGAEDCREFPRIVSLVLRSSTESKQQSHLLCGLEQFASQHAAKLLEPSSIAGCYTEYRLWRLSVIVGNLSNNLLNFGESPADTSSKCCIQIVAICGGLLRYRGEGHWQDGKTVALQRVCKLSLHRDIP